MELKRFSNFLCLVFRLERISVGAQRSPNEQWPQHALRGSSSLAQTKASERN
jgi:hypothetical protein